MDFFHVDNVTGALSCLREIDRESTAEFRVTLKAIDNGLPPKQSSVKVRNIFC